MISLPFEGRDWGEGLKQGLTTKRLSKVAASQRKSTVNPATKADLQTVVLAKRAIRNRSKSIWERVPSGSTPGLSSQRLVGRGSGLRSPGEGPRSARPQSASCAALRSDRAPARNDD